MPNPPKRIAERRPVKKRPTESPLREHAKKPKGTAVIKMLALQFEVSHNSEQLLVFMIAVVTIWQVSINALLELWDDVKELPNVKYLCTRKLNQDPLENSFSVIRSKGG